MRRGKIHYQGLSGSFGILGINGGQQVDENGLQPNTAKFLEAIVKATICPVCGESMVHYRLRGYKCWNEQHNEMVAQGYNPPAPPPAE
jgi:hypothetical protein